MKIEDIIRWFEKNPDSKGGVLKAYYAWTLDKNSEKFPANHDFSDLNISENPSIDNRGAICKRCNRTREQVRYDSLSGRCLAAPHSWRYVNLPIFEGSTCHHCGIHKTEAQGEFCSATTLETRSISDILREEESRLHRLTKRAETEVPKIVRKKGFSGETLAILHHTYGHPYESCEIVLNDYDFTEEIKAEYEFFMGQERTRSKARQKKEIITIK